MDRMLVKIVKEIAEENDIQFNGISDNWIIELEKNEKKYFIYGYVFENNNASITYILKDKNALAEILLKHGVPAVEHHYFYKNLNSVFENFEDESNPILQMFNRYKKLVLKNNMGTGGDSVYFVDSLEELKDVCLKLKNKFHSFSVCPFYDIKHEWRVIMQNFQPTVIYEKIRAFVVGDGVSSANELAIKKYNGNIFIDEKVDLKMVPKKDEKVLLNWKHNLGQGAVPKVVKNVNLAKKLSNFAFKVCNLLKIKFASIDIIEADGELKILEINGGIMMEKFSSYSEENYQIAKKIYYSALKDELNI